MAQLTQDGLRIVEGVAQRHGFSNDAVTTMLLAVSAGYGNQAQFNHPEFGGMGQWSSGGMVMIGDMFNNNLKGRVSALCQELSSLIQNQPLFSVPAQSQNQSQGGGWQGQSGGYGQQQSSGGMSMPGSGMGTSLFVPNTLTSNWWPSDLGMAGSTGSQNNLRYAYFPTARRLAIDQNGHVSVYDTGDHQIGGFGQQQSGDQSLTFSSQFGVVRVADLPMISGTTLQNQAPVATFSGADNQAPPYGTSPQPQPQPAPVPPAGSVTQAPPHQSIASTEIFSLIEKLHDLKTKGILTDSEYDSKKSELLGRL